MASKITARVLSLAATLLVAVTALSAQAIAGEPLAASETTVLFLGDSHTAGPFGAELQRLLADHGLAVHRYGCVGASVNTFFSGQVTCRSGSVANNAVKNYKLPRFEQLIAEHQPHLVIVALGANMFAPNANRESRIRSAKKIANALYQRGLPCVWIGPKFGPSATYEQAGQVLNDLYEGAGQVCSFIDSRPLAEFEWCKHKRPSAGRGCNSHFNAHGPAGYAAARKWAAGIFTAPSFDSIYRK